MSSVKKPDDNNDVYVWESKFYDISSAWIEMEAFIKHISNRSAKRIESTD